MGKFKEKKRIKFASKFSKFTLIPSVKLANLTEIYARIALRKTDFLLERAIFCAQIYQILSANLATNLTHNAACCATDCNLPIGYAPIITENPKINVRGSAQSIYRAMISKYFC